MATAINADQLLTDLAERLQRPVVPIERQLWDSADIAAFLRVSRSTVVDRYSQLPNFPAPIRLPSPGGRGAPRWRANAVLKWAEGLK